MLADVTIDYVHNVARGKVSGARPFSAYGERTTTGAETNILWPDGTYALPPAVGVQLSIVSASANDAAAGTGVRTLDIHGLDSNLNEVMETVTMNGTTPVLTTRTDWRSVQCMHMRTYGSGKAAAGQILASVGAQNYAEISLGKVRCSSSVRMVPKGKRLLVLAAMAGSESTTADASTRVYLSSCHFDGHDFTADSIFFPLAAAAYQSNSAGIPFPIPIAFTEGQSIGMTFATDKASTIVGSWFGLLEDA